MVHDADAMKLFMTVMGKTLQHVQVSAILLLLILKAARFTAPEIQLYPY